MFTLMTVAMAVLSAGAQQKVTGKIEKAVPQTMRVARMAVEKRAWESPKQMQKAPRKAGSDYDFEAYYAAPDGVFFMGVDGDMQVLGRYAYAPSGVELTYTTRFADYFNGDYVWDDTVENKDYAVTYPQVQQILQTPELYVMGYEGNDVYKMADDGLLPEYGYYANGDDEYYSANYQRWEWNNQFWDMGTLSTNYQAANEALEEALDGYHDITIRGFAEQFSYAKDYWISDVNADIVCPVAVTTDDVVAYVYAIGEDGQTGSEPLGTFVPTAVKRHDADSDGACYYVNFATPEPVKVTSPIMVVVTTAEGCEKNISPDENVSSNCHYGERGTSYIYADYRVGSTQHEKSFIPYSGIAMWGNWSGKFFYLNHWTVGIKASYTEPEPNPLVTSVKEVRQAGQSAAKRPAFSLDGRRAASSTKQLGKGIYVVDGRKVVIK